MSDAQRPFELLAKGDVEEIRRLLERDPTMADARDATGVSLLMQSLYRGHRDLAEALAAKKAALDIFEASSLGRLDRLKKCLQDSSQLNSRAKDGFTALHFACFFHQPDAVRILIEAGAAVDAVAANPMKIMPLHSAASSSNLEAARLLLEHGAPVNARQQGGWVPLHAAAQNGDRPMVDLLLKHNADPKLANDDGKTPAAVAREKGHNEIAAVLER
jgi:ankyrin repeat protein